MAKKTKTVPKPDFISRGEVQTNNRAFIHALNRAIEFHRTNTNDPHNIGNAVIAALIEVRDCFRAYM